MTKGSVRKSTEKAETGLSRPALLMRATVGILILGALLALAQPDIWDEIDKRILSRGQNTHGGITRGDAELATLFTPEVLYWKDEIKRWGLERSLNPNLIATIMQIESCGDPYVSSNVGAQGLFQVMPLHFEDGENQLNPETNAQSGLNHLADCLGWSNYDVGLAFACYNGGPSVLNVPQSQWYQESRDYYAWGSGIFADASNGEETSTTLTNWLAAGGSRLCQQAQETQMLFNP